MNTDRKPALTRYSGSFNRYGIPIPDEDDGDFLWARALPPAVLALTAPELRALAVFAEAMPELLTMDPEKVGPYRMRRAVLAAMDRAALAAAREAE